MCKSAGLEEEKVGVRNSDVPLRNSTMEDRYPLALIRLGISVDCLNRKLA